MSLTAPNREVTTFLPSSLPFLPPFLPSSLPREVTTFLPSFSFLSLPPGGGPQAFRSPAALPDSSGGGHGGGWPQETAGSAPDGGSRLDATAARLTLSSYHALVRASLRRALERGTWRAHACWECVVATEHVFRQGNVCPIMRPAVCKAALALATAAAPRGAASTSAKMAAFFEAGGVVFAAPPLFGSEVALADHLARDHGLSLDYRSNKEVTACLHRLPAQLRLAEPSVQMLDALLGVRGGKGERGCPL